jgi:hypothetical protein
MPPVPCLTSLPVSFRRSRLRVFTVMRLASKLGFWCLAVSCLVGSASAQQLAFRLGGPGGDVTVGAGEQRLTAVCFLGTQCPMARVYVGRLNELQRAYQDQGLRIVGVFSNYQDTLEDIRQYIEAHQVEFSVVDDSGNRVADQYGATRTPEVFLLDDQLKLRYHGRIDDQYAPGVARSSARQNDLQDAVEALLAGKPVRIPETTAMGCIIGRVPRELSKAGLEAQEIRPSLGDESSELDSSDVTFHKDVVAMIQRNCLECHRDGEIGPFAMDNYREVVGWAETMLETMENQRMPPWHADPQFGQFVNERKLAVEDLDLFRRWIAGGLVEGNLSDAPPPVEFTAGWQLPREPDLVIEMRDRPFIVPKSGVVEYQYFVAELGIDEDRWISSAEVKPGNAAVVHHAIAFIRPPDGTRFRGLGWLGAYVPGQRAQVLPAGYARFLPAGSKLVFQMHYTPNGTEQADVTRIGLNFIDESEVTDEVFTIVGIDQEFEIPPGVSHRVQAEVQRLPENGKLLAVTPHMHYRGKSFTLFAGEDRDQVVLNVPQYDFNWQHTYILNEPKSLDELRRLSFDVVFDNTSGNPFNPDPREWVTWGDQSFEEMAVTFFEVAQPRSSGAEHARRRQAEVTADNPLRQKKIDEYVARMMKQLDANGDGVIRRGETGIVLRRWNFEQWDINRDDRITEDEIRTIAEKIIR